MNSKRLLERKKQDLDLDSSRPLPSGHLSVGVGRPQCQDLQAVMGSRGTLAVLLLRHRWVVGLP
jgi:hypothetical protein